MLDLLKENKMSFLKSCIKEGFELENKERDEIIEDSYVHHKEKKNTMATIVNGIRLILNSDHSYIPYKSIVRGVFWQENREMLCIQSILKAIEAGKENMSYFDLDDTEEYDFNIVKNNESLYEALIEGVFIGCLSFVEKDTIRNLLNEHTVDNIHDMAKYLKEKLKQEG